jgi:hypothetical protein
MDEIDEKIYKDIVKIREESSRQRANVGRIITVILLCFFGLFFIAKNTIDPTGNIILSVKPKCMVLDYGRVSREFGCVPISNGIVLKNALIPSKTVILEELTVNDNCNIILDSVLPAEGTQNIDFESCLSKGNNKFDIEYINTESHLSRNIEGELYIP